LKKEIIQTIDGSYTLFVPELDETYHSKHGAIQESLHVFIKEGLQFFSKQNELSILEIGFGTGLNALTTLLEISNSKQRIKYTSLEAYPLTFGEVEKLRYTDLALLKPFSTEFELMHTCEWNNFIEITPEFQLKKLNIKLQEVSFRNQFDLIYFDAFAPQVQPDLWTEDVFTLMYKSLKPNGVLVTYCAKGSVKRALKAVGFELQSIPGPPGKREMSRAIKC
jgi:tRNA U34 5-methylaminomethyl-2-thiouridine-forming methyltransferase MnmC